MHLYVFMLLTHMDTSWQIKLMSVPTAFWSHWTDGCLTCRLLGALSCRALTQLRDGLGNMFRTNKSWNIGTHPKNLSVFHVFSDGHEAYYKAILQPRLQQQSCVDIVKAIKLMLQRGLVPESWTQSYWEDEDFGNVMSFDEGFWIVNGCKWCMCKKMQEVLPEASINHI